MFRDFAIVATAFGADLDALKRAGWVGALSVVLGVVLSFAVGAVVAVAFGFSDAVSISTIGAGAATYIVGPVTGTALGAGLSGDRIECCCGPSQGDPSYGGNTIGGEPYRPGQSSSGSHLWRSYGYHKWCSRRASGDRPKTCALWCDDRDLLYGCRVFAGAVLTLSISAFSAAAVLDKPF